MFQSPWQVQPLRISDLLPSLNTPAKANSNANVQPAQSLALHFCKQSVNIGPADWMVPHRENFTFLLARELQMDVPGPDQTKFLRETLFVNFKTVSIIVLCKRQRIMWPGGVTVRTLEVAVPSVLTLE